MAKASDNQFPKVTFAESSAPSTPSTGLGYLYEKTDGLLYFKNDGGTEHDLTAGSGTTFSWQSWSPTLVGSTTNPTIGNGTVVSRYMQIGSGSGSLVICHYYFELGSTSNDGAGSWRIDGPVTPYSSYDAGEGALGVVSCYDTSTNRFYFGQVRALTTPNDFDFQVGDGASSISVNGDGTGPFAWATGDRFSAQWMYEAD